MSTDNKYKYNPDSSTGIPQGSVRASMLYNIFTADIPQVLPAYLLLLADDTIFFPDREGIS